MTLLQLWLATAYPFTVAVLVGLRNRRTAYTGRHRGDGRMSWPDEILTRARTEVSRIRRLKFDDLTAVRYAHNGGVGRYVHLRPAELDAKAERDQALADMGLMLRSPWSTPAVPDEWEAELAEVAT